MLVLLDTPLKPKGKKQIEVSVETENNEVNSENSSVQKAIPEEQKTEQSKPQQSNSYKKYYPSVENFS